METFIKMEEQQDKNTSTEESREFLNFEEMDELLQTHVSPETLNILFNSGLDEDEFAMMLNSLICEIIINNLYCQIICI